MDNKKLSLPMALGMKRKKKMAKGGKVNESAKSEQRPMPEERDKDASMVSRNSGNKPSRNDSWTDNSTVRQAQKPSITKLSQPRMVGSDVFSVRNRDMHDDEANMMDRLPPQTDRAQPVSRDNEKGPNRQGSKPDMAAQHDNKRQPYNKAIEDQYAQDMAAAEMKKVQSYAKGGPVMEPEDNHEELVERDDEAHLMSMEDPSEDEGDEEAHSLNEEGLNRKGPDNASLHMKMMAEGGSIHDEEEIEHAASIAAAIMAKRRRMAEGGKVNGMDSIESDDSDQADLKRNAEEDANMEDQLSFNALRKENYSESEGLRQLDQPKDSNEHSPEHEPEDINDGDIVRAIRRKMRIKSAITK